MNFSQACKVYVSAKSKRLKTVVKIVKWNSGLTIKENANNLNINLCTAHMIAKRFSLKFADKKDRKFSPELLKKLMRLGLTLEDLAKVMGCSRQNVHAKVTKNGTKRI